MVVIAGATGTLGRRMIRLLMEQGTEVATLGQQVTEVILRKWVRQILLNKSLFSIRNIADYATLNKILFPYI